MATVFVFVGFLFLIVVAFTPLLLPWPQRVRWLVISNAARDPWSAGWAGAPALEEVEIYAVFGGDDGAIWVSRPAVARLEVFPSRDISPADQAVLREWASAGTPLLAMRRASGEVSLHSSHTAVTGLFSHEALEAARAAA